MVRHLLLFVIISFISRSALGTIQEQDLLILEGQRIYTYKLPSLDEAFPCITFPKFTMISTANYKGYRATWATFQKQLYLVGLEAHVVGKKKLSRNTDIIPEHSFPLKVTHWSGTIVKTERRSSLGPETMTWTDITETTTITVTKGVVTDTTVTIKRKPRVSTGTRRPTPEPADGSDSNGGSSPPAR